MTAATVAGSANRVDKAWAEAQTQKQTRHKTQTQTQVAVEELALTGFRNYASFRLGVSHARAVVLTGPNGAGKTNLLEAISLLAPGRGLRRARAAVMEKDKTGSPADTPADIPAAPPTAPPTDSHDGWAVSARIRTADGICRAGTGITAADAAEGKARRESA